MISMVVGILGNVGSGDSCRNLNSLEDAVDALKTKSVDVLVIGKNFPSCPNTRDIVIFNKQEMYAKLKQINPGVNLIFI